MKRLLHLEVNQYETMVEALAKLQKQGYSHSFKIQNDKALCLETKDEIAPEDMTIVEFHRFEGDTDPGDMSIIYVVECENGINGCLIDAYGSYADEEMSSFLQKIKVGEKKVADAEWTATIVDRN